MTSPILAFELRHSRFSPSFAGGEGICKHHCQSLLSCLELPRQMHGHGRTQCSPVLRPHAEATVQDVARENDASMQGSHNLDLSPHGVAVSRRVEQLGFTHVLVTTWDLLQGLDVSLNYYIYIYRFCGLSGL